MGMNRFGEEKIRPVTSRIHDEKAPDWSHDPRSESAHETSSIIKEEVSDEDIYADVLRILEGRVENLEIIVKDGVVRASGIVNTRKEKKQLQEELEELNGVKDLLNQLQIF